MGGYGRSLFSRLMLLHDGTVVGNTASSEEDRVNDETVPCVAALVIEPCGSVFHALHRDGKVVRQVTACCITLYFCYLEEALLFRNSAVQNPYVCHNLFHLEPFDVEARARWPIVSKDEIEELVENVSSADSENCTSFSCFRASKSDIDSALHFPEQTCCYANGTVVVYGVYDNDPSIFSLSPTGHFVNVSFSVSVPPLDEFVAYNLSAALEPSHCRVTQLFSARNVPPCFEYPFSLAQDIQKHYRLRNHLGESSSFVEDASNTAEAGKDREYIISPLPCLHKESGKMHWSFFRGDHGCNNSPSCSHLRLNATEILSMVGQNRVGNTTLSSHAIMVERTDELTIRAFASLREENVVVIEAHRHVDDSCVVLNGDFCHFYQVRTKKSALDTPHFDFIERVFHCGAIEHIDIGPTCQACIQFREQILKHLHKLDCGNTKLSKHRKSAECLKEERHENESGVYTVFPDKSIHILFRDRTTVDFRIGDEIVNIILPNAVQRNVSFRNPQEGVQIYVKLALDFANWIRLSPKARVEKQREQQAQRRKIMSEYNQIDRLLVLMDKAPIPMPTHCDGVSINNKDRSENIALDTMAEIEKLRQSIHACLHLSPLEVSKGGESDIPCKY